MKWLWPVAVAAAAVLAEITLGRASGTPDFALFLGRFHPLIVHLPIGFFLLVAMGEAATFLPGLKDRVEPALGLLVPLSTVAALGAFLMGQLLALEGGFPAGALSRHRSLTLSAIIGMSLCWVLYDRQRSNGGQGRWAYRGVMAAALGCLSLGAHFGGTMTRGESYLSKYAPGPLKPLLRAPEVKKEPAKGAEKPAAAVAEPLVYQDVLQPVLKHYCVDCHGPEKQKGKLRLDSLAELMKGGENGAAIVAGAPKKSLLLTRLLLPPTDDDHMPPEGKPGPKLEERALIKFWIERGASLTLKVRDTLAPTVSRSLLEHALGGATPTDSVPASTDPAPTASSAPAVSAAAAPAGSALGSSPTHAPSLTRAVPVNAATPANGSAPAAAVASDPIAPATQPPAVAPTAGATSGPAFLASHCEKCHGAQKQKGKLRVDSLAALLKGGTNGVALVPGNPNQSSIIKRVRLALSDEEHMPPRKEPQPSAAEIASLASWIRAGAGSGSAQPASAVAKNGNGSATGSTPSASSAASASGSASPTDSASAAATPSAAATSGDAVATHAVSGPPDAALLQTLPPQLVLFDAVRPLFREKCGKCHIRDKPAGGLMVDQRAQLLQGGFSGAGLAPKDRKASYIMQRLMLAPSDSDHMPPEDEPPLSADEVELIGSWIDHGAPAQGLTETASLTAGAARALSARRAKPGPTPISARAGGCAACSVPGARPSKWLGLEALTLLLAASALLATRRRLRPTYNEPSLWPKSSGRF